MKQDANKGLAKMYWVLGIIIILFFVLGGILWWYDKYLIHEIHEHALSGVLFHYLWK
jgi:uncharacterized membrane protein YqiK